MSESQTNWQVFRGDFEESGEKKQDGDRIKHLPSPPPWRRFRPTPESAAQDYWKELQRLAADPDHTRDRERGQSFRVRKDQTNIIQAVNAALCLRRPLLVTGRPGSGKTSLAYAIAYELMLGPVLMWPITARSALESALYRYDAIARLQDAQLVKRRLESKEVRSEQTDLLPESETGAEGTQPVSRLQDPTLDPDQIDQNIGDYLRLGPLGTAFLPTPYPRVLLIDEIDKSDVNLPNDLLNLLEEGQFEISELVRLEQRQARTRRTLNAQEFQVSTDPIMVRTEDDLVVPIEGGKIRCSAFPLIVMTSNGERDFPPAFLRRCLRVEMPKPEKDDLYNIVEAHLTEELAKQVDDLIQRFFDKTDKKAEILATDQLLNAVYLRKHGAEISKDGELEKLLLAALTSMGSGG